MIPKRPNNTKWTEDQWEAIYQTGKNIIVAAGAGSGKTAVLTERIIKKLKSGISIDSMIILTFTNAAAFEMKERVKKKLEDNLEKYPFLEKQLDLLDQAIITTFDSYSLSIVKKYHYLLDISNNISIIDGVVLSAKKEQFLDSILENYYSDKTFLNLLDTYTNKDDVIIRTAILNIYDKIDSICKKDQYLENYIHRYYSNEFMNDRILEYISLISKTRDIIMTLIESIKNIVDNEILIEFINRIEESLIDLNYAKKYWDYKKCIENFKLPSMTSSKKVSEEEKTEIKGYYDKLKNYINDLKELVSFESEDVIRENILKTKDNASIIISIIRDLDKQIFNYKKEINSYEFSDITRLAIKILEENAQIREDIKNSTVEIMIDEYQDTNDIGDYFISLISSNNVYMVGDVKQSIYRFRNANPKLFMQKYNDYKNNHLGYAIDLNKNFRSRNEVLNNINLIFSHIMSEDIGGVNYDHGHNMVYGNNAYLDFGKTDQNYNMSILNYNYKNSDFKKNYSKDEMEIFLIAEDIKNRINNHEKIFDMDNKILRDITYKDIVILVDRKSSFELYKKIFDYEGIPLVLHKDEEFIYSNEIYVIKNILKLINIVDTKVYQKINYPFISVARSYLFDYKDNDIFTSVTNNNIIDNDIFKNLFIHINNLVLKSKEESLSNLIISIYEEFNMFEKSTRIGNVDNVNKKLNYIIDIATNLENIGYSLIEFIAYFDSVFDKKLDIQFSDKKDVTSNSVSIMTIHKSKGLEYPICYFPQLYKKFNKADLKDRFNFNYNYGIVMPIFSEGLTDTIYKRLLIEDYLKEDISERLRVLYVALTRAKEKIVLVNNINEIDSINLPFSNDIVNDLERLKYTSFEDVIVSLKSLINNYVETKEVSLTKAYLHNKDIDLDNIEKVVTSYSNLVLNIEKEEITKANYSHKRNKIEKIDHEEGIYIHEILEYLDFKNYMIDLNNYELNSYMKNKIISLFKMPFMDNINNSKVFKEYEFYDNDKLGIIDLLIEKEDKYIIVDYKLKDIDKSYYIEQVSKYIDYIKTITNKDVEGYIYSIIDERYKKI